jgi:hypothetical protein
MLEKKESWFAKLAQSYAFKEASQVVRRINPLDAVLRKSSRLNIKSAHTPWPSKNALANTRSGIAVSGRSLLVKNDILC